VSDESENSGLWRKKNPGVKQLAEAADLVSELTGNARQGLKPAFILRHLRHE
jgi:hypothetical protein